MSLSEQLAHYNPVYPGQKRSRLEHLAAICAFRDEWLEEAAERLEGLDAPHVAAFFQVPQPVYAEPRPYQMPAKTSGIVIELEFKPILMDMDINGHLTVCGASADSAANATQVIAYIPLWGKRADHYSRYERCFTSVAMKNEIVMTDQEYWGGRTLRAKDYEYELCSRLEQELKFALRRFLKSYSTIVRLLHVNTDPLYSLFFMPFPRRVAYHSIPVPLASHFFRISTSRPSVAVDATKIQKGVDFTYRNFSRFELQIFELNKLAAAGNHALALVGSLALIEWLFRLSAPSKHKALRFSQLIELFATTGLLQSARTSLDELRKLRNVAVHLGEHADLGQKRPHEIFDLNIDKQIDQETAKRAIDLAWLIFQESNSGRLASDGSD